MLEQLLAEAPSSQWWFDLGLMHKWRQDWEPCLLANQRSAELDPRNTPAYWNGGIAATALHDWSVARACWAAYGVKLPEDDGVGEPQGSLGPTPIRVDLNGGTEVVWCDRLDPARALIVNVPGPDCVRRWHDIVLHDGEPKGERKLGRQWVPVFEEIALWRPSPVPKLQVEVSAESPAEVEALVDLFAAADRAAEDWGSSIVPLCRACSEGRPDPSHEHPPMDDWQQERRLGLGCEPSLARELLEQWRSRNPLGRKVGAIEVLEP